MTDDTPYEPTSPSEYLPTEWLPRDELEPNDWNPNEMGDEERKRLFKSLMDNGWTQPIVLKDGTTTIIDGEQRWSVSGDDAVVERDDLTPPDVPAGYVPVYSIDVDEGQARISTVQHNRARGNLDANRLKTYLKELDEMDVLESVHDRIGIDREESQLLLDEVTAAGVIGAGGDFGEPWEPVDRTEKSEDEMEESRSAKVREAASKARDSSLDKEERAKAREIAQNSSRVNFVLTPDEHELVEEALGTEEQAESFLNLIHYFLDYELVDQIRPEVDYESENPYEIEADD